MRILSQLRLRTVMQVHEITTVKNDLRHCENMSLPLQQGKS